MELPDRDERDERAAAIILLLMARHRVELVTLLGDPPDVASVPAEFWERIAGELSSVLALILLQVYLASAELHGAAGAERQGEALLAGLPWSEREAERLAGLITGTTRRRLLEDADDDLAETLAELFSLRRAILIASDAVTDGQHNGAEFAVERYAGGLSEQDVWHTADDPCPVCSPLDGKPRSTWESVGDPPLHPFCRCWIEYASVLEAAAA